MKISEIITDKYKLRIPPTVYYDLLADAQEAEEEQEPKTGHWSHDGSHWKNRFICSECGYKLFDELTNFCPNCGAKMIEPQESKDKEENNLPLCEEVIHGDFSGVMDKEQSNEIHSNNKHR